MYIAPSIGNLPHQDLAEVQSLKEIYLKQKQNEGALKSYQSRIEALQKLFELVQKNKLQILNAISQDYGHRCHYDTEILEFFGTLESIRYAKKHLKKWMKPKRVSLSKWFKPAKGKVIMQPKGVIGIMVPWNYPLLLSLHPLVDAIAAGNNCMVKMSEFSSHCGELLKQLIGEQFSEDTIAFITGELPVSKAFAHIPFDHLFFTGSSSIGKAVMNAASQNLTPVTLELGGKSPTVIHTDYPLQSAVNKIMQGKFYNAGQTCIAPDYIILPKEKLETFTILAKSCFNKYYPDYQTNRNYSNIITENHVQRLQSIVDDAKSKGAQHIPLSESRVESGSQQKMQPSLLVNVDDSMLALQDEIFGPILPIVLMDTVEQAVQFVSEHPEPLAIYYFDNDKQRADNFIDKTKSGGVTINETLLHASQNSLPFGGIGASGMGKYHGYAGFQTFSHQRSVFIQSRLSGFQLLRPPFGKLARMITHAMQKY